jgi:hypothetical protein
VSGDLSGHVVFESRSSLELVAVGKQLSGGAAEPFAPLRSESLEASSLGLSLRGERAGLLGGPGGAGSAATISDPARGVRGEACALVGALAGFARAVGLGRERDD